MPIKTWEIWNEANYFYFAYPVSPFEYAKLLKLSAPVIKRTEPGAKVILTGLFGRPTAGAKRGMPAAQFLEGLYKVPGIKSTSTASPCTRTRSTPKSSKKSSKKCTK